MVSLKKENRVRLKTSDIIIISMIIITFIISMMLVFLSYKSTKQEHINSVERSLKQYSEEYKNYIEDYFEKNYEMLEYLTTFEEVYSMEWDNQYEFLSRQAKALNFEHFIVMDNNGYGYYTNRNEVKNQSDEPFYQHVIENERFLTEPFMEEYENRSITTLSVSINVNGEKVGSLCGVIDLDKIYEIFADINPDTKEFGFLINKDGDYIAHNDMKYVHEKLNLFDELGVGDNNISFLENDIQSSGGKLGEIKLEGVEYYASFVSLDIVEWGLVFLMPKDDALIVLNKFRILQWMIMFFGVMLLVLGINLVCKTIENYKLAHRDTLTGLNNRAAFNKMFDKMNLDFNKEISIICFDLNDFKYINDTYGHYVGDTILSDFASILIKSFSANDFIARTGGDEFVTIIYTGDINHINNSLGKLDANIKEYNKESKYKLKVSYGYATRKKGNCDSLYIIQEEADKSMYEFKRKSKQ